MYAVPLAVLIYEECLETMGVVSGAANRRVNAVGVFDPLLAFAVEPSMGIDGSSTSFSALGILVFRDKLGLSFW